MLQTYFVQPVLIQCSEVGLKWILFHVKYFIEYKNTLFSWISLILISLNFTSTVFKFVNKFQDLYSRYII